MVDDALKPHASRTEWTVALGVAVAGGLLAINSSDVPMRWFVVYLGAALLVPTVLLLRNAYSLQLGAIVFSLQAYMCLTLMADDSASWVGRSGPSGLEIHIQALLAAAALVARWPEIQRRGLRVGGEMLRPLVPVVITLVFATLVNRERAAGVFVLAVLAQCYFVYAVTLNLVTDERYVRVALGAFLLTTVTQSCVYFVEYVTHVTFTLTGEVIDRGGELLQRHGGLVSTHPSGFAEFMNLCAMVAVALYLASPSALWRRRSAVAAVLGTAAVLLTLTRAAWIGFVLAAVMLVWVGGSRKWLSPTAVMTMALAGILMLGIFSGPITGVFMKEHTEDLDERVVLSELALQVIEERPVRGVGPGAYGQEFRNYIGGVDVGEHWLFIVHNHYLLRAAEAGIQGLLALLWLFWCAWRLTWASMALKSPVASRLALGLLAGMVALFFQFYFDIGNASCVHFTFWFLLGLLEALRRLEAEGVVVDFEDRPAG